MRHVVWGVGALFGTIMVVGGLTQDTTGWWIGGGLIVYAVAFVAGTWVKRYQEPETNS
jgi:heme A synthase